MKESTLYHENNISKFWQYIYFPFSLFWSYSTFLYFEAIEPSNLRASTNFYKDEKISEVINTLFTNFLESLDIWLAEKDQFFENWESCELIEDHYGNETFSLKTISKEGVLKATLKTYFLTKHPSQMTSSKNCSRICKFLLWKMYGWSQ